MSSVGNPEPDPDSPATAGARPRVQGAGSRTVPDDARGARRDAGRMIERRLFNAAVGLLLVHAVDDAVLHRGPGTGVHWLPLLLALAAGAGAVAAFPRSRP